MRPFELRAPGVVLATPTSDDVDRITELCQAPSIQRFVTIPVPYTRADAVAFVTESVPAGWETGREPTWSIRDPEDRRVLGMIGLRDHGGRVAEVGFWLAPEERGRGIASAAVRLVADYAFAPEGMGARYLRWRAIAGNVDSRRVAWATGFRVEDGRIPGLVDRRGEPMDGWWGTLTAGDPMRPRHPWLSVPDVEADGVRLRPFDPSDADAVVEACSDPVSQHWLTSLPSPYTRADAEWFIDTREDDHAAGAAVHAVAAATDGGALLGAFALMRLRSLDGGAEIGYWVHPAARGAGVATTAVRLLIEHAFTPADNGGLGLQRLIVAHAEGNDASRAVIERNGFRTLGVERAAAHLRGGVVVDRWWYDLLADDWRRR